MKSQKKYKFFVVFILFSFIITTGFGCKGVPASVAAKTQPIILTYWRVGDDPDAFADIIAQYKVLHPFITINYKKLRLDEYEDALLNAFAEDRGPDILSINNTWMTKYQSKLAPEPPTITMAYPVVQGTINKEVVTELRDTPVMTPYQIKNNFMDVVSSDAVGADSKVYGLPMALDTLALYYNRDLLNNAGITAVPQYWNREFQDDVKKLTRQDIKGNIIQSGVAMGGASNIERFSDALSLLIMQNGGTMVGDNGQVMFQSVPAAAADQNYNPGLAALRFYADFADPNKEVYAWNNALPSSLSMFISGNLAFRFGYNYDLATIKAQAPKLNFSVAPMPQIEGASAPINFANYWLEGVSKKSKHINEAWDFILFATRADQVKSYLAKTKRPTALRALVSAQRTDPDLGVFADQLLTSRSWYKGCYNPAAAEKALGEMIDNTLADGTKIQAAMGLAAGKVQQTFQAPVLP
jgi:multiple sugar transport system substrate-binding protein